MKRFIPVAVVLALSAAGCDETLNPVAPTAGQVTLVSSVAGANVVPPAGQQGVPAGALEAGAAGSLSVSMAPASGGNYTASFTFSVGNLMKAGQVPVPPLDNGSVIVAGYIFPGTAGGPATGLPVVQLPISTAAPIVTPTGSVVLTISNVTVAGAAANAILANPSGFFFSLHSAVNQGGVVRGQLVKQ
jgi:hypothetical protein